VTELENQQLETDLANSVRDFCAPIPYRSEKRADTLTMKKNLAYIAAKAVQPSFADLSR
jgi:hypothetical protein